MLAARVQMVIVEQGVSDDRRAGERTENTEHRQQYLLGHGVLLRDCQRQRAGCVPALCGNRGDVMRRDAAQRWARAARSPAITPGGVWREVMNGSPLRRAVQPTTSTSAARRS